MKKGIVFVAVAFFILAGCAVADSPTPAKNAKSAAEQSKAQKAADAKGDLSKQYNDLFQSYQSLMQLYLTELKNRQECERNSFGNSVQDANKLLDRFRPAGTPKKAK